ncbi:MAG: hypothetical protein LBQ22_00835 [Bacteroidales bacterium]|jgi:hypothetical protein|nr:hypothetical protein [Bacteroidales bacterium]
MYDYINETSTSFHHQYMERDNYIKRIKPYIGKTIIKVLTVDNGRLEKVALYFWHTTEHLYLSLDIPIFAT